MLWRAADSSFRVAIEVGDLLRPHQAGLARYAECLPAALIARREPVQIEASAKLRRAWYCRCTRPQAELHFFWRHPPRRRPQLFHSTSGVFPEWRSSVEVVTVHDLYAIREELRLPAD